MKYIHSLGKTGVRRTHEKGEKENQLEMETFKLRRK